MNPHAIDEAYRLKQSAGTYGPVVTVIDGKRPDVAEIGGTTYDLTQAADRRQFAGSLGLDSASARKLEDLLSEAQPGSRDEMARVIDTFRRADRGEIGLERVVLSGHSTGPSIYGEDGDRVEFRFFEELARVFPGAAGQVQDLMLSACNTGGDTDFAQYRAMFPHLQSVWGYDGKSPPARARGSSSVDHIQAWERVSRGDRPERVDAASAPRTEGSVNAVRTWNSVDGPWSLIKG